MDSLTVLLSAFTIVIYWIYKLVTPSSKHWKYGNKIPGAKPIPLMGNALLFLSARNYLAKFLELSRIYGSIYRLWIGKQLFIILSDPDDVEKFLSRSNHLNKSDTYRLLDTWLGNKGLLTSDGKSVQFNNRTLKYKDHLLYRLIWITIYIHTVGVWRTHRKILTPAFHFKMLENSLLTMKKNAEILSKQLENKVNQPEFDVQSIIEKCSLDIISETAMGIKLNTQISNNSTYLNSLKKICNLALERAFKKPWLYPEFLFKLSSLGRKYFETLAIIKNHNEKVIIERKATLEDKKFNKFQEYDDKETKKLKPFLDILLTESNFTDEEIRDEVQNFMFAGHDTTTVGISFCLYALSNNQHVQDKLYDEIKNNLLNKDTEPTYQSYTNMKYLDCVVKESLRIYTPVPMIARKVDEDIEVPSGYIIPKGALVNFFLIRMHNDEKYFPNPTQFKPERFEDNLKHPYSYVPFSAGLRNCLGQKFALLEMKIVLTTLLSKYRFLPATQVKSITLDTGIVLRSLQKVPLRIVERN